MPRGDVRGRARKRAVLVIDDDEPVRDALAELLRSEGYEVQTAGNGLEALERLHAGPPPGVILVDLLMPVMDGWQFCAAQAEDPEPREIPVSVVSATGDPNETPRRAHEAGFFRKPADLPRLLSTVARYCDSRAA